MARVLKKNVGLNNRVWWCVYRLIGLTRPTAVLHNPCSLLCSHHTQHAHHASLCPSPPQPCVWCSPTPCSCSTPHRRESPLLCRTTCTAPHGVVQPNATTLLPGATKRRTCCVVARGGTKNNVPGRPSDIFLGSRLCLPFVHSLRPSSLLHRIQSIARFSSLWCTPASV